MKYECRVSVSKITLGYKKEYMREIFSWKLQNTKTNLLHIFLLIWYNS